jgi:hypothetical protein
VRIGLIRGSGLAETMSKYLIRRIEQNAAIIPVTIAGIALLRCGCAFAAFAIEIGVGLVYFVWILL